MSRRLWAVLGVLLSAGGVAHCSSHSRPGVFQLPPSASAGGGGEGFDLVEAGLDAAVCGSQQIPAVSDPPNLYFVVDRSGSMGDALPGSPYSKYVNARIAMSVMLRAVGHRVRYGAAIYPANFTGDGCSAGTEVFPVTAGDPPSYAAQGKNGPQLSMLLESLASYAPGGSTPTAATLRSLEPMIASLPGKKTYVVLVTDGAPNCNTTLSCGPAACIPNIEHDSFGSTPCDSLFNCCDPKQVGTVGVGQCVDADDSEAAVAELEKAGIDTYVVGMPGSEAYSEILTRLAVAGNTARPGASAYYAVSDTSQLSEALRSIGAHVSISCELPLAALPENPELVNVYFDDQVVPSSDTDGWRYTTPQTIEIVGKACSTLGAGDVLNVRVLSGCPTVVR